MRNMQGPNRQANLLVSRRYTSRAAGGAAVTSGGDAGKVSDPADGLDGGAGVPPGGVRAASVWPGASRGAASASSDKGGAAFSSAPPLSDLPARRTFNFEPMISCTRSLLSGSTIIRCFSGTRMSAMGRQVIHWGSSLVILVTIPISIIWSRGNCSRMSMISPTVIVLRRGSWRSRRWLPGWPPNSS